MLEYDLSEGALLSLRSLPLFEVTISPSQKLFRKEKKIEVCSREQVMWPLHTTKTPEAWVM